MLADDIVAVDSRAIIRTLSAAGTQSRTLRRIGCGLETLKDPMPFIIEGSYARNCLRQRPLKLLKHGPCYRLGQRPFALTSLRLLENCLAHSAQPEGDGLRTWIRMAKHSISKIT